MECRVPRVIALIHHVFRRFVRRSDLDELSRGRVHFAEMDAQPALAVVNFMHENLRFIRRSSNERALAIRAV
jgi:hypothetical protein